MSLLGYVNAQKVRYILSQIEEAKSSSVTLNMAWKNNNSPSGAESLLTRGRKKGKLQRLDAQKRLV